MIGARVGNWFLEAEIGRGATGVVYRARGYDDPARTAAVKVLTDPAARDPAFLQRFPAEMLSLQRLSHPNIVRFHDSGTHGGLPFYAAELVEATDYATILKQGRRPWREVLNVAVQAAHALRHGHQRNALHRDLKPAHLLLAPDGTLKLAGYGVAKVVKPPVPDPAAVLGSAAYIPPETASGKPLTRRGDLYSLGGVLYTLVTGRPPFTAGSLVELMHKQCYALPERPALLVPDLPPELDEFICTLLDKSPSRRPATAAAVLDDLDRLRGKLERKGERVTLPADPGTVETAPLRDPADGDRDDDGAAADRPARRLKFSLLLGGLVVVAAVLGWAFLRPGPSAEELYAGAQPLLASGDPADLGRAWDEYLEPLSRKYPDRYAEEVAAARTAIQDRRELRRALAAGADVTPHSDAERGYLRGLRLAHAGDPDAARRTWRAVATGFAGVASERRWVDLSRAGLAALDEKPRKPPPPSPPEPLAKAIAYAAGLPAAESAAAFDALELLLRDDPGGLAQVRRARAGEK